MTTATAIELEPAPEAAPALELMPRADNLSIWSDLKAKAEALKLTAETLNVTNIEDTAGQKLARATRLSLREIRIAVEKRRKDMVEDMTKETARINSAARAVKEFIEPLEARLEEQEKFIERETARLENERRTARSNEIRPFLQSVPTVDLGKISEEEYQAMLADAKDLHALKLKREADAEAARLAKEKAEADERERIRLENIKLKEEAEARDTAAKAEREAAAKRQRDIEAKAEADRKAAADVLRKEREAAAAKAEKERKAAEEARRAIERERQKEREAAAEKQRSADAAAAKERAAREKLEKEKADAAAAEERRKEVAAEAEKQRLADEAEARRKAAAAPDREKLIAFADSLAALSVPDVSKVSAAVRENVAAKLQSFVNWIKTQAATL